MAQELRPRIEKYDNMKFKDFVQYMKLLPRWKGTLLTRGRIFCQYTSQKSILINKWANQVKKVIKRKCVTL